MKQDFENVKRQAESWKPEQILRWAFDTFGSEIAMATGFGIDGMALIDIAIGINPHLRIFTGDTEFLFPETYDLIDRVEKHYGIKIERLYSKLTPEEQQLKFGVDLWKRNPDLCCNLRKIEPLKNKLSGLQAWITAIRRDQTSARAHAKKIEWDDNFQLLKISPLADWSASMVWDYVRKRQVPYNPLHERGFPSIGCTHCTRAIKPGEHTRAGRWAGFQKTECGLHTEIRPSFVPLAVLDGNIDAGPSPSPEEI